MLKKKEKHFSPETKFNYKNVGISKKNILQLQKCQNLPKKIMLEKKFLFTENFEICQKNINLKRKKFVIRKISKFAKKVMIIENSILKMLKFAKN